MVSTKTCKLCKKEFETKAHNALYCPECRKEVKNARRRKDLDYLSNQSDWVLHNSVHKGTKVRVFCEAEDYQDGWASPWPKDETYLGLEGHVVSSEGNEGILVLFDKEEYSSYQFFPYFVLEVVHTEDEEIPETEEKSDFLKMAEQNVLNRVREAKDWIAIIGVLRVAGDTFFPRIDTDPIRKAWCDGLVMAENALYYVLCKYQADALIFTGIGGEEAEKYAREKFRERFSIDSLDDTTRYEVLHLLDEYLDIPHCAKVKDEIEFRRQAEQRYRDTEKD